MILKANDGQLANGLCVCTRGVVQNTFYEMLFHICVNVNYLRMQVIIGGINGYELMEGKVDFGNWTWLHQMDKVYDVGNGNSFSDGPFERRGPSRVHRLVSMDFKIKKLQSVGAEVVR